jgi:RNA 2',3'-cyclic 3'-phosphodiesterase
VSRLFVAVWLPPVLTNQLRALDRPVRPGLRWTTEDQWHVTLRFLGQVRRDMRLTDRLDSVAAGFPPPAATLGPNPTALGDRVWAVPVDGLDGLATAVEEATSDLAPPASRRRFHGHLTLARGKRPGSLAGLPAAEVGGTWTVDVLTLVSSHLHPDGARYEVLERWPLGKGDRVAGQAG